MKRNATAIWQGTGKEGKGLAYRWARAGYHVLIGSRDAEKASNFGDVVHIEILGSSV